MVKLFVKVIVIGTAYDYCVVEYRYGGNTRAVVSGMPCRGEANRLFLFQLRPQPPSLSSIAFDCYAYSAFLRHHLPTADGGRLGIPVRQAGGIAA